MFCSDLRQKYRVTGLPSLIAVSRAGGDPISKSGRGEVTDRGTEVFREWLARAKGAQQEKVD